MSTDKECTTIISEENVDKIPAIEKEFLIKDIEIHRSFFGTSYIKLTAYVPKGKEELWRELS